jgi:hypothetical protein
VKRAFDAMQEFVNDMTGNVLETYMVAGESKVGSFQFFNVIMSRITEGLDNVVARGY